MSFKDQQEYLVAGLPNVNITIAKRLLREFRSVQGVFDASAEDLEKVHGIGRKKADEIRKVLTIIYDG